MRPVNLIPPDLRRGVQAPSRTGPIAYFLVGALALILGGVTLLVLTSNDISQHKADISRLKQERTQISAEADRLASYTQFNTVRQARVLTVGSLADSRFDWQRVLDEFSRVMPSDIWLVKLTGKVRPDVDVEDAAQITLRGAVPGPALELVGCAPSYESLAGFVSALRDIDGVTRVGVLKSERPPLSSAGELASAEGSDAEDCRTRDFITRFEVVVAFDAAPVTAPPAAAGAVPAPVAPAPAETPTASEG
jgi:Tfp pilus assembly protein PilN